MVVNHGYPMVTKLQNHGLNNGECHAWQPWAPHVSSSSYWNCTDWLVQGLSETVVVSSPATDFFVVGARCLSAGRTWDSRVDQQGFEPPPAVCQRWQDQRHTNWAIGSPVSSPATELEEDINSFFSVQRLHCFRQVVTSVQTQETSWIVIACKAVKRVSSLKRAGSGPIQSPVGTQRRTSTQWITLTAESPNCSLGKRARSYSTPSQSPRHFWSYNQETQNDARVPRAAHTTRVPCGGHRNGRDGLSEPRADHHHVHRTFFFSVQRRMASARSFNMFPSMLHMRLIN